jgi:hypothetical protein
MDRESDPLIIILHPLLTDTIWSCAIRSTNEEGEEVSNRNTIFCTLFFKLLTCASNQPDMVAIMTHGALLNPHPSYWFQPPRNGSTFFFQSFSNMFTKRASTVFLSSIVIKGYVSFIFTFNIFHERLIQLATVNGGNLLKPLNLLYREKEMVLRNLYNDVKV